MNESIMQDMVRSYMREHGLPAETAQMVRAALSANPAVAQQYVGRGSDSMAIMGRQPRPQVDLGPQISGDSGDIDSLLNEMLASSDEMAVDVSPTQKFAADVAQLPPNGRELSNPAVKNTVRKQSKPAPTPVEEEEPVAATTNNRFDPSLVEGEVKSGKSFVPDEFNYFDSVMRAVDNMFGDLKDYILPIVLGASGYKGARVLSRSEDGVKALTNQSRKALPYPDESNWLEAEALPAQTQKRLPAPTQRRLTDQSGNNIDVEVMPDENTITIRDGNVVDEGIEVEDFVDEIILQEADDVAPKPGQMELDLGDPNNIDRGIEVIELEDGTMVPVTPEVNPDQLKLNLRRAAQRKAAQAKTESTKPKIGNRRTGPTKVAEAVPDQAPARVITDQEAAEGPLGPEIRRGPARSVGRISRRGVPAEETTTTSTRTGPRGTAYKRTGTESADDVDAELDKIIADEAVEADSIDADEAAYLADVAAQERALKEEIAAQLRGGKSAKKRTAKKLPEGSKTPSDSEGVTPREIKEDTARRTNRRLSEAELRNRRFDEVFEEAPYRDSPDNLRRAQADARRDAQSMAAEERAQAFGEQTSRGKRVSPSTERAIQAEEARGARATRVLLDDSLDADAKAAALTEMAMEAIPRQFASEAERAAYMSKLTQEFKTKVVNPKLADQRRNAQDIKSMGRNADKVPEPSSTNAARLRMLQEAADADRGGRGSTKNTSVRDAMETAQRAKRGSVTDPKARKVELQQGRRKAASGVKEIQRKLGPNAKVTGTGNPDGTFTFKVDGKRIGNKNWATIEDAKNYINSKIDAEGNLGNIYR